MFKLENLRRGTVPALSVVRVFPKSKARLQNGREDLPENACEGDVLKKVGSIYEIDKEKTESRRKEILKLQNSLWS